MRVAVAPVLLAALLLVSGCTAGKAIEAEAAPPKASHAEGTGGIEGLVIDPEYRPVAGARVQIIGVPGEVNATLDGRFAFSDLVPQDYLVIAKADGFFEAQTPATVPVGNVTKIQIVLHPVPPPTPYADPFYRFAGMIRYGAAVQAGGQQRNSSGLDADTYPDSVRSRKSNVAKNDLVPTPDWQTLLVEVEWRPTRDDADRMALEIYYPTRLEGGGASTGTSYFVASGKSPLKWRMDRDQFERLRETNPRLDFSTFVGVWWRVHVAVDASAPVDYGVYVEQPFIVYGTVGYNGPLPADYTRTASPA